MQAIRHTINALRGISRWGTGDMVEAAFRGFAALPPPASKHWSDILQVNKDLPISQIELAYKIKAKQSHPDTGGSQSAMSELNNAISEARQDKAA